MSEDIKDMTQARRIITQQRAELAAARALLREFVDDAFFSCRNVELTEVDGHDWNARVKKHLDACDTLGDGNANL